MNGPLSDFFFLYNVGLVWVEEERVTTRHVNEQIPLWITSAIPLGTSGNWNGMCLTLSTQQLLSLSHWQRRLLPDKPGLPWLWAWAA